MVAGLEPLSCSVWAFRIGRLQETVFNQSLSFSRQNTVAIGHVGEAFGEGRRGGLLRQAVELGRPFQILRNSLAREQ